MTKKSAAAEALNLTSSPMRTDSTFRANVTKKSAAAEALNLMIVVVSAHSNNIQTLSFMAASMARNTAMYHASQSMWKGLDEPRNPGTPATAGTSEQ